MAEYYYTVASLPMLTYSAPAAIDEERFLEVCRYTLNRKDYEVLSEASIIPLGHSSNITLENWYNWERTLRNELAVIRAQNTGIDYESYIRETDYRTGTLQPAKEAAACADPLAGEDVLNKARWMYLDELEAGHYFDLEKLIVYYLRLQINSRRLGMNRESGEERYSGIYGRITDKILQSQDGEL